MKMFTNRGSEQRSRFTLANAIARIFSLVIVALSLASCVSRSQKEAKINRAKWDAKGPARYQFTFQWNCFCPQEFTSPTRITVHNDVIVEATDVNSGTTIAPASRDLRTIDGLFDLIHEAFQRDADRVDVTYDPTDGHPVTGFIDYEQLAADEELGFTVSDFQALP
jgi:hypothetical protein